jgi:hypothetical protein
MRPFYRHPIVRPSDLTRMRNFRLYVYNIVALRSHPIAFGEPQCTFCSAS